MSFLLPFITGFLPFINKFKVYIIGFGVFLAVFCGVYLIGKHALTKWELSIRNEVVAECNVSKLNDVLNAEKNYNKALKNQNDLIQKAYSDLQNEKQLRSDLKNKLDNILNQKPKTIVKTVTVNGKQCPAVNNLSDNSKSFIGILIEDNNK